MYLLAYGQFRSTEFSGMCLECLPFLLRWLMLGVAAYGLSSFLTERCRARTIGIATYLAAFFCLSPSFAVMGAWGPAHVAASVGFLVWPIFLLLLVAKVMFCSNRDGRHARSTAAITSLPASPEL